MTLAASLRYLRSPTLIAALLIAMPSAADVTLIHAGMLLAVPGEPPQSARTVVVENGRVQRVAEGYLSAAEVGGEATVIDLRDRFVMPGLIDMHVHLRGQLGPDRERDALKMSRELMQMRSYMFAMRTLEAGFTTVRDLGSFEQSMYAMRDAIERGWLTGPRIVAAGRVGITGGHADVSGMKAELMEFYTHENVCDGPYDCRRAARNAIKYGADLIKITSTGGVMTDRATGTGQQMEMDELKEVVRAAERMGRKVASHAHQEAGIIAALEAGVHSIEHGTYTGPDAIKLFKKTGTYLVPTLLAGETVVNMAKTTDVLPPAVAEKAIRVGTDMQGNFERAWKAGVKVAFGTDSGISPHGENAQEAVLMHRAGMPPMAILESATVNAADLLGMSDSLGTIEAGKHADIIALAQSPLERIEALLDVGFVMKGGEVVRQE